MSPRQMNSNTPTSEQEALLDKRISELNATQRSMDDTPLGKLVDGALLTLASCVFGATEVLDYFEETNELPEVLRDRLGASHASNDAFTGRCARLLTQ
jgi:hypothetical protein